MRHYLVALILTASLTLGACGTTQTRVTTNAFSPKPNATTMIYTPDVELSVLMVTGLRETRADWSKAGEVNITNSLKTAMEARGADVVVRDRNDVQSPRELQLTKLTDAVMQTSLRYDYRGQALPTHKKKYSRSIGPGASLLGADSGAQYSLMVQARGSYQSGGKVAMNIAMAALGNLPQVGGQTVYAALIDLETGDIVWSNLATAAPGQDMRKPAQAERLVNSVLKDFPL